MNYWEDQGQDRGRQLLAELQANPSRRVRFIESADIASLVLALLERIQRLEEAQQRGQRQEQQE